MAGTSYSITINFDTGIEKIEFNYGSDEHTFLTSGETYVFYKEPGNNIVLTATLKAGYTISTSTLGTINNNIITIEEISTDMNVSITTNGGGSMSKSVDLATLTGWSSLSDGTHTITIKAKADGYRDSEASAGVEVTKQGGGGT